MSTLHVENLKGLSSGGNANKIIVPSGQTLTAPGHVVQVKSASTTTAVTLSSGGAFSNLLTVNIDVSSSANHLLVSVHSPNLRKVNAAGTGSWWTSQILINGSTASIDSGALGYPETFADHRYLLSKTGLITSGITSGTNTVILQGSSQSSGSNWVFSYQGFKSEMVVMEIAQ